MNDFKCKYLPLACENAEGISRGKRGGYFEYSRKRNYCMILDANIFHSLARMLRGYPGRKRGGILNSLGRETIVRFQRGCPGVRGGIF